MNHVRHIASRCKLAVAVTLAAAGLSLSVGPACASAGDRLILLGTAGGPSIKPARAQPGNALIVGDAVYIVDAGDGTPSQMGRAGVSAKQLRALFITHNHSDHTADVGTVLLRGWASGMRRPVQVIGPPPMEKMIDSYLNGYMAYDIQLRIVDEGHIPLPGLVKARNIAGDGPVYSDENVKVTAVEVPHGAAKPSYAFRFDTRDGCSVVFTGDTSGSPELYALSKGVDILVHEVVSVAGVKAIVDRINPANKESQMRHIIESHTPPDEAGKSAQDAGVKMLVLNHFVPTGLPQYDNTEAWTQAAGKHYRGNLVVGQDLMVIPLCAK